ncbi:tRNA 2'-phosphotransferase Tpt1 [Pseudohyphozyma bogoriensis]|nr:tRNA 2'-phosphotransferase Tpt1 [Pseudohyphozyma bogoriensis]
MSTSIPPTIPPAEAPAPSTSAPPPSAKPAKSARGRPSDDADTRHSKTLSYILRHGAAKESLVLRKDGFVRVVDLMKRPKLKGCDMDTLERIVRDNAKQRFTMRAEPTGPNGEEEMWIRANQGHSVVVEDLELKKVDKAEDVPVMVHGTYWKLWDAISNEGLKPMTRTHVHCAVGLVGDEGVKSGMRNNCDLFIYLDVPLLLSDGIPILTSSNNVVLTPGIVTAVDGKDKGSVPPKYFKRVPQLYSETLLPTPLPDCANAWGS